MADPKASVVISAVDQVTEVINRITGGLTGLQSSFGKLSSALAIGGSVTWLANLSMQAVNALDDLDELSQGLGIAATRLSSYQLSARRAGVDQEQLTGGLTKLNKAISEAAGGNVQMAAIFDAMGVAFKDASGKARGMDDVLGDVADRLAQYEDGAEKSALVTELFGKAGAKLIAFLNEGKAGLEKFGGAQKDEIEEAKKFAAEIDKFATSWEKLKLQIGGATAALANWTLERTRSTGVNTEGNVAENLRKGIAANEKALAGRLNAEMRQAIEMDLEWQRQQLAKLEENINRANAFEANFPKSDAPNAAAAQAAAVAAEAARKKAIADAEALMKVREETRASLLKEVSALEVNTDAAQKLNDAQKLMLKVGDEIAAGKLKLSQAETLETFARLKNVDATLREKEAMKATAAEYEKRMDAQEKSADAVQDLLMKQLRYNDTLGLSKQALAEYEIAEKEVRIAQLERIKSTEGLTTAQAQELAQLKLLVEKMREGSAKEASIDAAKTAREEWQKAADQIEQSLTDALVQGFEGGKSFVKSIGDYIVNFFRSYVARGIAQALMGAIGSGISGIASATGIGGSGGGAGGLGGLGNLSSLLGGGSALGTGFVSGLGTFGSMAGFTEGASLLGAGFGAEGIGMMAGAAAPYIAAAYGLYRLISGVGTGRSRGPAYQEWSTSGPLSQMFAGGINNPGGGSWQGGHYDAQISALVQTVSEAARALGGSANARTSYGLYSAQSPDGRGANTISAVASAAGNPLLWVQQAGGNADVAQLLAQQMPAMILAGLRDSNLPTQIRDYLNKVNVTDQASLDAVIATASAAHQMAEAFKDLGGPFAELTNISVEARSAIAELTGGLDAFTQKVQGYYSEFYSQEERSALSLVEAQRTLGAAGIDTSGLTDRASYRALVESIDPRSNPEQFAALINAAGAFASGSDILGMSGMSLRDFTAGAPGLEVAIDPVVTAQDTTNTLLGSVVTAIYETSAAVVAAIGSQQIAVDVRTSQPSSVEVGYWPGTASSAGN